VCAPFSDLPQEPSFDLCKGASDDATLEPETFERVAEKTDPGSPTRDDLFGEDLDEGAGTESPQQLSDSFCSKAIDTPTQSLIIEGLEDGAPVQVAVVAINAAGNVSLCCRYARSHH